MINNMRNILPCVCLLILFSIKAIAQDAWKNVPLKGKIYYHSVTTTKQFDADGNEITKSEAELIGSTDQVFTFYPGRYQLMAKSPKKLDEFYEANIYHIFFRETYDSQKSIPIVFPIEFSSEYKEWSKCDNAGEFLLMKSEKANGVSNVTNAKTYLSMIKTRSQKDVEDDKLLNEGMNKWAQLIMKTKRANDIKSGKTINEDDYFLPAGLHNSNTFGLYIFTNWWSTDYKNLPVIKKYRDYNCDTKKWEESAANKGVDLYVSDNNRKLTEDYNEDANIGRFRYFGISTKQLEKFINKPDVPTTFTGGSYAYFKDNSSESETRIIIKLTVSTHNAR